MEPATMAWTAGLLGAGLVYWFVWVMGAAEVKGKRAVDLKMGSITRDKVQDKYTQYWSFFRRPKETATTQASADKVPAFVDTFYNLVTDIYEWGWGQSFHFSPSLPGLRRQDEIASIAQEVGFEVVQELDLALPPSLPWWTRLKMGRLAYWRNSLVVRVLTLLRIAPKGVVEVHEMLYETAQHLTLGGETGIFSPMHMVVLRKPATAAE
ncbi:unnamed protein product [Triticum turgidum subsp. durum]|uniref:SAM-dependent methyltransferase Erg6/SMT-type domain-containing protein n=1 Tax=Triticum turgidum subsp. durum TaxID=4567 RepID=A0A9R0TAV4_TRITD|nr:unnamed protein product [Triticum turgidum subsp. durum]